MKLKILSRLKEVERSTKAKRTIYFGSGTLTPTDNGYDLSLNVSRTWFKRAIVDIIERHFETLEDADSFLEDLERNGYINIVVQEKRGNK